MCICLPQDTLAKRLTQSYMSDELEGIMQKRQIGSPDQGSCHYCSLLTASMGILVNYETEKRAYVESGNGSS